MNETFGQALRRLRSERGISQTQLGRLVTYSGKYLSDFERGRRLPGPDLACVLDATLGATGLLVDMAARESAAHIAARIGPTRLDPSVTGDDPRQPLTADDAEELHVVIGRLVAVDTDRGADDLADLALCTFTQAQQRLATHNTTVTRDLYAAVAELGEVAGWLCYDADRPEESRRVSVEALLTARLAGDRGMEQFLVGHLSMLDLYQHRAGEALRLADMALESEPVGRAAAMFHLRRGRALADLGTDREALAELSRARSMLGDSVRDGTADWSWWLHTAEMTLHESLAHSAVGHHAHAVDLAHRALAGLPARQSRDQAVYRGLLLGPLVAAGAWADVEQLVLELLPVVGRLESARVRRRLRQIAERIDRAGAPGSLVEVTRDWR